MAIEPYRQRIGVSVRGSVTEPRVGRLADAGEAIQQAGRSLIAAAEPIFRERAEEEAIAAAGEAAIVRDENGNWIRPEVPPGGGRVWRETYDRIIRERHSTAIVRGVEVEYDRITREHFMDPEAALESMAAFGQAAVEAAPADIRAVVETNVAREMSERFRGIAHRRASEDRQNAVNGLTRTWEASIDAGLRILSLGGEDAERRAQPFFDAANQAERDLLAIGAMNETAIAAGDLVVRMRSEDAAALGGALTNSRGITQRLADLTTPELQTVELWSAGVRTNAQDRVLGMDFDQFQAQFPGGSEHVDVVRRRVGTIAGGIARDRIAEQRERERAEREERQSREQAEAIAAAIAQGFDANYTYDERQRRALDNAFLEAVGAEPTTPVDQYMGTPEGRRAAVAFAAETGYLPTSVRDYIESRIYSQGAPAVAELAQNLRNVVTREGVQQGYRLYQTLSPQTRAAVDLIERLRRGGENEETIAGRVDSFLRGRAVPVQEARGRFVAADGSNTYDRTRDQNLRRQLGVGADVHLPGPVRHDYDEMLRWNLQIFDDPGEAARETARQVASGWARHEIFLGGMGPRHFATLPMTIGDLDEAFLRNTRGVPREASFAPGARVRARLETLDIAPTAGLGRYRVHVYNQNGHEMGWYDVDADERLAPVLTRNRQRRGQQAIEQQREARRRAADSARRNAQLEGPAERHDRQTRRRPPPPQRRRRPYAEDYDDGD